MNLTSETGVYVTKYIDCLFGAILVRRIPAESLVAVPRKARTKIAPGSAGKEVLPDLFFFPHVVSRKKISTTSDGASALDIFFESVGDAWQKKTKYIYVLVF